MAKDAYYFSHDSNARNDEKLLEIRARYDWWGYGLYFAIIEVLHDSTDYQYSSNALAGLSLCLNVEIEKLTQFLNDCFELNLLTQENDMFFSESLKRRMMLRNEKHRRRVEAGRKGGNAQAMLKQCSGTSQARKVKESKVKEINITFDEFWKLYDKKVGDKKKLEKKWASLSNQDREKAIIHITLYKTAKPDKQYRKDPSTYLNNSSWNDEIIYSNGNGKHENSGQPPGTKLV